MNNLLKPKEYFILVVLFLCSCDIEAPALTPEEKYTVDTLFNQQLTSLRIYLDSSCNASKDTVFVKLVDSLKNERMKDIESLLMPNQEVQ